MPRQRGSATFTKRVGARVRALREEVGITQESLAWESGLAKGYLSQVESGQRLPSLPALQALAKTLKVQLADLVACDLKNPHDALLDAVRRGARPEVEASLRALGLL